jgi:hypothetical protein
LKDKASNALGVGNNNGGSGTGQTAPSSPAGGAGAPSAYLEDDMDLVTGPYGYSDEDLPESYVRMNDGTLAKLVDTSAPWQ